MINYTETGIILCILMFINSLQSSSEIDMRVGRGPQ